MKRRVTNQDAVRRMVSQGYMATQIAAELRISADAVRQMAHRHNLPLTRATSTFWNDERRESVRRAIKHKMAASECAKEIGHGCTRNMVLSAARRMGLLFSAQPAATPKPVRPKPAIRKRPAEAVTFASTAGLAKLRVTPAGRVMKLAAPHSTIDPEPSGGGVPLTSIGAGHCRWPFGVPGSADFGFCGAAKVRGSYCASHAKRAYVAAKPAPARHTHGRARRAA